MSFTDDQVHRGVGEDDEDDSGSNKWRFGTCKVMLAFTEG